MKAHQFILVLLASALIAGGVAFFVAPKATEDTGVSVGSGSGQEHYNHESFLAAITRGGRFATSTDDTTATALGSDFKDIARYDFTPNVGSITLTLPATSTMSDFVPRVGDTRDVFLCNATTTAATPFTLAAGTGMNLVQSTSTLAINTTYCATLTFSRKANSDIDVFYNLGY